MTQLKDLFKQSEENHVESRSPRKQDRQERVPLGTIRTKLAVDPIEGYIMRWINDRDARIANAELGGYEFITYEELGDRTIGEYNAVPDSMETGAKVSKVVGKDDNGAPLTAFLMKIKKEWYKEDQKKKSDFIDATEQGLINLEGADDDLRKHQYGSINISR